MARKLNGASLAPAPHDRIEGLEHIDKIIDIDQSPIGRTPRSNPATYTGAFTPIREWFAALPESKARGYEPGRFSFNVKGGRCEACQGDGVIKIEMHFLPDVYVTCDVCKGKRYNRETLEVLFKGKSIADVLDMTVEEALEFFKAVPRVRDVLALLHRVGLDYIHVGQQATTLSGGEAQRVKLAKELSKRATGRTLYILDEPTTGLHFHDVAKLLEVLHELVDRRQHRRGDRAQSRGDQDRRLGDRPRPRRRRRRRRDRRVRHAGRYREGEAKLHRAISGAGAGAPGAAEEADRGGGVTAQILACIERQRRNRLLVCPRRNAKISLKSVSIVGGSMRTSVSIAAMSAALLLFAADAVLAQTSAPMTKRELRQQDRHACSKQVTRYQGDEFLECVANREAARKAAAKKQAAEERAAKRAKAT